MAGTLAGCSLGGGSGAGSVNNRTAKHPGTALVVVIKETGTSGPFAGQSQTYDIPCGNPSNGDAALKAVCTQLTVFPTRYFGAPAKTTLTHGPGDVVVSVHGVLAGLPVKHRYRFGEAPQFANWIRLLRRAYPPEL
ncbi:MAG TPA: hypothetical protein VGQ45_03530 [Gaiellales bacterium]|nr:hypothetical protein [Gaiellales bacterium]